MEPAVGTGDEATGDVLAAGVVNDLGALAAEVPVDLDLPAVVELVGEAEAGGLPGPGQDQLQGPGVAATALGRGQTVKPGQQCLHQGRFARFVGAHHQQPVMAEIQLHVAHPLEAADAEVQKPHTGTRMSPSKASTTRLAALRAGAEPSASSLAIALPRALGARARSSRSISGSVASTTRTPRARSWTDAASVAGSMLSARRRRPQSRQVTSLSAACSGSRAWRRWVSIWV